MSPTSERLNYSEIKEEEEEEYIVEKILDKRIEEKKIAYYLIKWKGYGDEENTWEPKSNLSSEMIKEYEKRQIQNQGNEKQDFDDIPDYEKKRLENIEMKNQFFKANLQNTISALKAKQEVAKPFKCDKCPAAYTGEQGLKYHQCSYCDKCKKNFRSLAAFALHCRNVHGKEFKLNTSNQKPKRIVKKLVKSLDNKSLKNRTTTMKKKIEKPYKCSRCQFGTIYRHDLKRHMLRAHGGRFDDYVAIVNKKKNEKYQMKEKKPLGLWNKRETVKISARRYL